MSIKIALLIDINCFPDVASWKEHTQNFQETVLERLFLDTSFNGEFDPSELVWTYKFYDSGVTSAVLKTKESGTDHFLDFDRNAYEGFVEGFENQMNAVYRDGPGPSPLNLANSLTQCVKHVVSVLPWAQDYSHTKTTTKTRHLKSTTPSGDVLDAGSGNHTDALTSGFEQSPSHLDTGVLTEPGAIQKRNIMYIFTRVPRNNTELIDFLGREWSGVVSSDTLSKILLGKDGYDLVRKPNLIQVKFVDTGYYKSNGTELNNIYPFPLPKVFSTLGYAGCIVPSVKPHDHGRPGFPSWKNMLQERMLGSSTRMPQPEIFKQNSQVSLNQPTADKNTKMENDAASVCSLASNRSSSSTRKNNGPGMMDSLMRGKIKAPYSQEQKVEAKAKERRLKTSDQYSHSQSKGLGLEASLSNTSSSGTKTLRGGGRSFIALQNPKKPILVAQSSKYSYSREDWSSSSLNKTEYQAKSTQNISTSIGSGHRESPAKRVRRNLFSSQPCEAGTQGLGFGGGKKTLSRYSSAALSSLSSRSPSSSYSFRSPVAGGSPGASYSSFRSPSTSRFYTSPLAARGNGSFSDSRFSHDMFALPDGVPGSPVLKSISANRTPSTKRRVTIDESPRGPSLALQSPDGPQYVHVPGFHGVICPESPATPPHKKLKSCSVKSSSSCEKRDLVPESPETSEKSFQTSFSSIKSASFYTRGESSMSQSWTAAEKNIRAARIKNSVRLSSLHSQTLSLSLDDLELIPSPGKSTSSSSPKIIQHEIPTSPPPHQLQQTPRKK